MAGVCCTNGTRFEKAAESHPALHDRCQSLQGMLDGVYVSITSIRGACKGESEGRAIERISSPCGWELVRCSWQRFARPQKHSRPRKPSTRAK